MIWYLTFTHVAILTHGLCHGPIDYKLNVLLDNFVIILFSS